MSLMTLYCDQVSFNIPHDLERYLICGDLLDTFVCEVSM